MRGSTPPTTRTRRSGGTQLCPACLSEDRPPYIRAQWRLAWHTACAVHECVLHDCCPECGSLVMAHRLQGDATHVAVCATCGTDLRTAPATAGDYQRRWRTVALTYFHDLPIRTSAKVGDEAVRPDRGGLSVEVNGQTY